MKDCCAVCTLSSCVTSRSPNGCWAAKQRIAGGAHPLGTTKVGDRKEDTWLQFCISGFLPLQLICDRWFTSCLICLANTLQCRQQPQLKLKWIENHWTQLCFFSFPLKERSEQALSNLIFADLHERGHNGVRGGAWSDHSPGTLPSQHFERGGQSYSLL